jgi:hypothetical protein
MRLFGGKSASAGNESILDRLVGEQLTQVWFVMDYVQLIFGGDDSLQCFVWPRIDANGRTLAIETPGYRDALCAFLTANVTAVAEDPAIGLAVEFATGRILIAPTASELRGPEIAMFHDMPTTDGNWAVWQPGDNIFPHLV